MYGSIRKSYGAKKASRENETKERKVLFGKKKTRETDSQDAMFQETSYMNVEANKTSKAQKSDRKIVRPAVQESNNNSTKSEFPIASVILTIVFTMMVMVLAFGLGGV